MQTSINARDLEEEMAWLSRVIDIRLKLYFGNNCDYHDIDELTPPQLVASSYAECIEKYKFGFAERLALALALAPVLCPERLDIFFLKNNLYDRRYSEFGGNTSNEGSGFLPTVQTLFFLLTGDDLNRRLEAQYLFAHEHPFIRQYIFRIKPQNHEPLIHCPLRLSEEYETWLTTGQHYRPNFGSDFPAQLIETELTFDDVVLHPGTLKQVQEIQTWITHGPTLMNDWGMRRKLRPGHRSLFYGPPGTGKTMTAGILGKTTGRDVYKVDLSLVVSKYIGETEKNLAKVFDQAESRDWILFFDEADALFGKRSDIQDAHDRYANQETAFLLQRLECFDGIAILASNFKDNLDAAFARRFEAMIYFPMPRPEERLRIWQQGLPSQVKLGIDIDLIKIAKDYELTGGMIINVIRQLCLQLLHEKSDSITLDNMLKSIQIEFSKIGKVV